MGEVKRYTQGVCMDGAAILLDGKMQTIEEILGALNGYDALRAENAELVAALELYFRAGAGNSTDFKKQADARKKADAALAKHRGERNGRG